jgi:hypothetical protein
MAIDAPQFTDCFNSTATQEFIMFYYTASLQFAQKTTTTFDLARTATISGLYWTAISLIKITLWLIDATLKYIDRDAHLIALSAFAQAHAPLPEFPAAPS